MCQSQVTMLLPEPDGALVPQQIDECIAPIIRALNDGGIHTFGCCCGHGEQRGYIKLLDGRVLVIFDMAVEPDEAELNRALGIIPVDRP